MTNKEIIQISKSKPKINSILCTFKPVSVFSVPVSVSKPLGGGRIKTLHATALVRVYGKEMGLWFGQTGEGGGGGWALFLRPSTSPATTRTYCPLAQFNPKIMARCCRYARTRCTQCHISVGRPSCSPVYIMWGKYTTPLPPSSPHNNVSRFVRTRQKLTG
jgi:hypothetical protein